MDNSSSSQILNQIFGHTSLGEQQNLPMISTGGRNQYVEIDRFETEKQLKNWLQTQGRKWGIVQKGRVTIEDIIDQYACIFRRRKGYCCRVQMRVRHNRRSGHKIVEVLPVPHDHNFYGPLMVPNEFDDGTFVNQSSKPLSSELSCDKLQDVHNTNSSNSAFEQNNENLELKQEINFSSENNQSDGEEVNAHQNLPISSEEQSFSQPMEMLWSNLLDNHTINLFDNVDNNCSGVNVSQPNHKKPFYFCDQLEHGDGVNEREDAQTQNLNEEFFNSIVEKVAGHFSVYIDSKFDAIIGAISTLTRNVDELKHSFNSITKMQQQQNQVQHRHPISTSLNNSGSFDKQLATSRIATFFRHHRPVCQSAIPVKTTSVQSQQHCNSQNLTTQYCPINESHQCNDLNSLKSEDNELTRLVERSKKKFTSNSDQAGKLMPSSSKPNPPNKFNSIKFINNTMESRKSRHAYRQRRRELSYKFMKEVGMMLTINGCKKTIFHWRASELFSACQMKRRELVGAGKHVMYRGIDVTEKIYRVDCSRDLVNGRRCGQMVADSLWPRGYFQRRMLLPILKGVNHRSKKRVNGLARSPVEDDQFETFKVALLLLGGFLMDETDRYKWMETAREGVNQRGLDELANSKRAHYEYDGGPLFANDVDNNEFENEVMDAVSEGGSIRKLSNIFVDEDYVENKIHEPISELPTNFDFIKNYETLVSTEQQPKENSEEQ